MPSNGYLGDLGFGLGLVPPPRPTGTVADPSNLLGTGNPPPAAPTPPPPPPPPQVPLNGGVSREPPQMSSAPAQPPAPPAPPQEQPYGLFDTRFIPVQGGGMTPARETRNRGANALQHMQQAQTAEQVGAMAAGEVRAQQAAREAQGWGTIREARENMAADVTRQNAAASADIENARQQHIQSVQNMSKGIQDDNDTTANIGGVMSVILSLAPYGLHRAGEMLNKVVQQNIQRDLEVKKFNYQAGLNKESATQRDFNNAVEKAGSLQVGMQTYRAAHLDATAAAVNQYAAENRGTEAGAKALDEAGRLQANAERETANTFVYTPAQQSQGLGRVMVGGQLLSGLYTPKQADEMRLKYGVTPQQSMGEKAYGTQMDILKEQPKLDAARAKEKEGKWVPPITIANGPNGKPIQIEGYEASSGPEAEKHREQREAMAESLRIIDDIKARRNDQGLSGRAFNRGGPIYTPEWRNKNRVDVAELKTKLQKSSGLTRMSEQDIDNVIKPMTDETDSIGSAGDVQLDALHSRIFDSLNKKQESNTGTSAAANAPTAPVPGKDAW